MTSRKAIRRNQIGKVVDAGNQQEYATPFGLSSDAMRTSSFFVSMPKSDAYRFQVSAGK